jgi:hypothetical protein
MFLPSEAVYAELHAKLPEVVRAGFDARVWIVSPTTCMATLNTMRAVMKDARMREQAGEIRKALRLLHRDVEMIEERAGKLETHLRQAGDDVSGLLTASARAGKRAERLDHFDFEELSPDRADTTGVVAPAKAVVPIFVLRTPVFCGKDTLLLAYGALEPSPFAFSGRSGNVTSCRRPLPAAAKEWERVERWANVTS